MSVTFPHAIFEFCSYLSFSHCFTETVLVLLRAGTVSLFGETLLKNLETEINALIAQGESVKSENAVKVRTAVTDASKQVSTLVEQAKAQYTDLSAKAQKAFADLQAKASELAAKLPINKQAA